MCAPRKISFVSIGPTFLFHLGRSSDFPTKVTLVGAAATCQQIIEYILLVKFNARVHGMGLWKKTLLNINGFPTRTKVIQVRWGLDKPVFGKAVRSARSAPSRYGATLLPPLLIPQRQHTAP